MPVLNLNLINLSEITNILTKGPPTMTLAAVLPLFAGFKRWLELFLVGCVFEMCRRVIFRLWDGILDSFWITVDIEEYSFSRASYGECFPATPTLTATMPLADHTSLLQTG